MTHKHSTATTTTATTPANAKEMQEMSAATTTTTKSKKITAPPTPSDARAPQNHRKQQQAQLDVSPPPPPPSATTLPHTSRYRHSQSESRTPTQEPMRMPSPRQRDDHSRPATMERRQRERQSWVNMRRQQQGGSGGSSSDATTAPVTPSPQTSRSYVSNVSTIAVSGVGGGGGGVAEPQHESGRTTAASGRNSSSGVATISGSSHTLNDIISDYHSSQTAIDYHQQHQYAPHNITSITTTGSPMKNGSFNLANGSTVKLLPKNDDDSNQQTKCSVFRSLVLCVCLNVTYANVVRFPRELDRYGLTYLIPYVSLLFLVGLPIALLEVSVGQFLGQSAAHTWRASPIFKGACIVSRFASWFSTIWISLQAVVALAYIGMLMFNTLPFAECVGSVKMALNRYMVTGNSGQDCLYRTFLTPFWENPLYFGLLSIGLICIWIVAMLCTHNGKTLRRCLFCLGLVGFGLLCALAGWEVHQSLLRGYFPQLLPLEWAQLNDSNIWFNALCQVIFSTNIGFGVLPTLTGKFLYKGDAVRTAVVYLCFNLLVGAVAVTLFMAQFDLSMNGATLIDELKPLTAVYDRAVFGGNGQTIIALLPGLLYALAVIAALVSITIAVYTSTRLVPRHPNYVIGLVALVTTIIAFAAPRFTVARLLDSRIVGTLVITALVFELIAITWIYGAKNIYTDLEFSIGRPIMRGWMWLWCIGPSVLTGVLVWWCSDDDQYDLLAEYVPRWAPILFVLSVIFVIACVQIFRQVEYNFFGMICEASKSAKEWGPADPLARHAWKQWRSVCQDTGRRDFTLRRRGTRDYTHSIKKGQYSTGGGVAGANNQALQQQSNWKSSSTPGNSSPNYSGSMFGDSAIEEDISVDKFPGITQQAQHQPQPQYVPFQGNDGKALRYSHRSRAAQRMATHQQPAPPPPPSVHVSTQQQQAQPQQQHQNHREVVYIRRLSDDGGQHATRIEITPSNESITYNNVNRNPLGRNGGGGGPTHVKRSASSSVIEHNRSSVISVGGGGKMQHANGSVGVLGGSGEHICWRKFAINGEEYSTEL